MYVLLMSLAIGVQQAPPDATAIVRVLLGKTAEAHSTASTSVGAARAIAVAPTALRRAFGPWLADGEALDSASFGVPVVLVDSSDAVRCERKNGREDCNVASGAIYVSLTKVRRLNPNRVAVTRRVEFNEHPDAAWRRVAGYESEVFLEKRDGSWVITGSGPTKVF